jgi:hypothetical protein
MDEADPARATGAGLIVHRLHQRHVIARQKAQRDARHEEAVLLPTNARSLCVWEQRQVQRRDEYIPDMQPGS